MGLKFNLYAKRAALLGYGLSTPEPHSGKYDLYRLDDKTDVLHMDSPEALVDFFEQREAQSGSHDTVEDAMDRDVPI
ncbi:hypothetical protein [Ferrimonas marina]|uniref:Uncharacterized protein n=1 Tax=Ferrimonas marina TaxID=299255 RepID=A0A1M5NEI6_9GAMM|nr:hypothetical protein [Ferrimonas marina]SHG87931.1 hypothetical protein SAMN02745129_1020 [Ferrimonas marina]